MVTAVLLGLAISRGAVAGGVLDRVRADGIVHCAAEERPAVAAYRADGAISGIAVDLCRAIAIASIGRNGRVKFEVDGSAQYADVAFVSGADAAVHRHLIFGPTVFVDRLSVLVPLASRVWSINDLAGETVCLMIGSPEQSALEATASRLGIDLVRLAFEEDVEMYDAYAVGRCGAIIGPEVELSGLRGPIGVNRLTSRVVPEALALVPVVAAAGTADGDWSALVFWVARALLNDIATPGQRQSGETTPPAGIRPDWRRDVDSVLPEYRARDTKE